MQSFDLSPAVRARLNARFVEQAMESMAAIERAAAVEDRPALAAAAHALRGPALYTGEHAIVTATSALESWTRESQPTGTLRALVLKLSEAVDALVLQPFDTESESS